MNNIEELIQRKDLKAYPKKKQTYIRNKSLKILGSKAYTIISVEEICELVQAITKCLRNKPDMINLMEEIVDVEIVLSYVKDIYKIDSRLVNKMRLLKFEDFSKIKNVEKMIEKKSPKQPEASTIHKNVIKKRGNKKCIYNAMKRLSKLSYTLSSSLYSGKKPNKIRLVEEIADIEIALDYIKMIYKLDEDKIEKIYSLKFERCENRMKKGELR